LVPGLVVSFCRSLDCKRPWIQLLTCKSWCDWWGSIGLKGHYSLYDIYQYVFGGVSVVASWHPLDNHGISVRILLRVSRYYRFLQIQYHICGLSRREHRNLFHLLFIKLLKTKSSKNEFLEIQEDKIDALRAS
jgi:hypothetical protein